MDICARTRSRGSKVPRAERHSDAGIALRAEWSDASQHRCGGASRTPEGVRPQAARAARRRRIALIATLALSLASSPPASSLRAQQPERPSANWTMPRTPAGHPDLQGNWTNATVTPIQRPEGQGPVFTREEVARIEGRLVESRAEAYADSDPDREAPARRWRLHGQRSLRRRDGRHGWIQRLLYRRRRARRDLQRRTKDLPDRRSARRTRPRAERGGPRAPRGAPAVGSTVRRLRQPGESAHSASAASCRSGRTRGRRCSPTTSTTTTTRSCRRRTT